MPAFEAAARYRPAYIELDFRASADGQLVCIHDLLLDRYVKDNQPQRVGQAVNELNLAELLTIDMGSWKSPDFQGEPMPTLEAVLRRFARYDSPAGPKLMIEHKSGSAAQYFELHQHTNASHDRLVVMSFNWDFIKALRQLDPRLPLALLGKGEMSDEQIKTAVDLGAVALCWNRELTRQAIGRLHDAGLQAWMYTINEKDQWQNASAIGVDAIATDYCDVMSAM